MKSLVAYFALNRVNASVKADSILLQNDLLLDEGVDLLLKEVALIYIDLLMLLEVFLKVGNILDDLLKDIVSGLSGMMLQCGALASQQLHFFLVVIQELDSIFRVPLHSVRIGKIVIFLSIFQLQISYETEKVDIDYYLRQGH